MLGIDTGTHIASTFQKFHTLAEPVNTAIIPIRYMYTPPSKSLASLCLADQLVVIPLIRWPFFQEYHTEYFKISYDKC